MSACIYDQLVFNYAVTSTPFLSSAKHAADVCWIHGKAINGVTLSSLLSIRVPYNYIGLLFRLLFTSSFMLDDLAITTAARLCREGFCGISIDNPLIPTS